MGAWIPGCDIPDHVLMRDRQLAELQIDFGHLEQPIELAIVRPAAGDGGVEQRLPEAFPAVSTRRADPSANAGLHHGTDRRPSDDGRRANLRYPGHRRIEVEAGR